MAQITFSLRMDEAVKRQFDELCDEFGITPSAAMNMFAKAVVRERRIPFDIRAAEMDMVREKAVDVLRTMQRIVSERLADGMSMEDINEELRKTLNTEFGVQKSSSSEK